MKIGINKIIFLSILLISLLLGILSVYLMPDFPLGDGKHYIALGEKLAYEGSYMYQSGSNDGIMKPGYPFFLAGVFFIFGKNLAAVKILQFLMVGLISYTVYLICKKHLKLPLSISLMPAIISLFWPYFILYANLILTETLYSLTLILFIYSFLNTINQINFKNIFLTSLYLSLAALVRPIPLLLPLWIIGLLFMRKVIDKKRVLIKLDKQHVKTIILALLLFILFLTPWSIYVSLKTKTVTFVASNGPDVVRLANVEFDKERHIYKTPGYEKGSEWTWGKFIKSKLKNIYRFWKSGAEGYNVDKLVEKFPAAKYLINLYRIIYYILISLGLASIYFINKKREIFLLWIMVSYVWTVHIALFPYPRLTLPIIPIMILLAFYVLNQVINKYKTKNQIHPIASDT